MNKCLECINFVDAKRHGNLTIVFCAVPDCEYCNNESGDICYIHSDKLELKDGINEGKFGDDDGST